MKPVLAILCLLSSAALYPAAILAGNDADQSTVTTQAPAPQDSIASKIKSEMADENISSMTDISVSANSSGVVSLSGTASQDDLDKVVSIAHNIAGVTAVNNNVTIKQ
jgi:hyperosmotically inducible protein